MGWCRPVAPEKKKQGTSSWRRQLLSADISGKWRYHPRQWRHPKLVWGSSDSTLADLLVSWDLLKRAAQLAKDGQIFHSSSISSTRHWLYPLTSSENPSSAPVCSQNVSFVSGTHRQLLGLYSALHTQQLRPWEDAYPHAGAQRSALCPHPWLQWNSRPDRLEGLW